MIKTKNKLFQRKKRQLNNLEIKRLYNLFRNRVNRELQKAKRNYYTEYFEENCNNINNSTLTILTKLKFNEKFYEYPGNVYK